MIPATAPTRAPVDNAARHAVPQPSPRRIWRGSARRASTAVAAGAARCPAGAGARPRARAGRPRARPSRRACAPPSPSRAPARPRRAGVRRPRRPVAQRSRSRWSSRWPRSRRSWSCPASTSCRRTRSCRSRPTRPSSRRTSSGSTPRWGASSSGAAFPANLAATYFDRFWDASVDARSRHPDIHAIGAWGDLPLGDNAETGEAFVMLVRSELLRRYPNAVIYATRPGPPPEERQPIFTGGFEPDVRYIGFDIPSRRDRAAGRSCCRSIPRRRASAIEVGDGTGGGSHVPPPADNAALRRAERRGRCRCRITLPSSVLLGAGDGDPGRGPRRRSSPGPGRPVPALDAELARPDLPLALFPVRLETRFFPLPDGRTELRVRVYPDKVHIDSHDPAALRRRGGLGAAVLGARLDAGQRRGAPARGLGDARRPLRAGARGLDRPGADADESWRARRRGAAATPPKFPDLGPPATVARTARVRLLPPRWVATAYAGGGRRRRRHRPRHRARPRHRPRPRRAADAGRRRTTPGDRRGHGVDGRLRPRPRRREWRCACRCRRASTAVDVLLVTGRRRAATARDALAAQLDAHRYTDGLAFVPPGTPSNNTAAARSGLPAPDPRHAASWAAEWGARAGRAGQRRRPRGARLRRRRLRPAAGRPRHGDEAVARAMATALWPATWGYFLSQMIGFEGGLTPAGRDWVRGPRRRPPAPGRPAAGAALRPPALRPLAGDVARRLDARRRACARWDRGRGGAALHPPARAPRRLARPRLAAGNADAGAAHRARQRSERPTSSTCCRRGRSRPACRCAT